MTKFKYENEGGRGYSTFNPFSKSETAPTKGKLPSNEELLLLGIKNNKPTQRFDTLS